MPASLYTGTTGNDSWGGGSGPDTLLGLAGDDSLSGNAGDDSIDGGDGNDTLRGDAGNDTLLGGAGNDSLGDTLGANLIEGGDGNDIFIGVSGGDLGSTLIGGAGRDLFRLDSQIVNAIYFGTGNIAPDRIADFQAGAGGDQIDLTAATAGPVDWTSLSPNPFVAGLLRLQQAGADTLVQLDHAGSWVTLLVLGNTQATAVTADNMQPGWNPQGPAGLTLTGTPVPDLISGGPDNDSIAGGGGADTLLGGTGADSLDGGAGNDCLVGADGADTLSGGDGRDTLLGYAGADLLLGGDAADSLNGGADNDSLDGGAGGDTLDGGLGNDTLQGGDGNDSLTDTQGSNLLQGGNGNDIFGDVSSGAGNTLTGGAGQDTFRLADSLATAATYTPGLVNPDQITDFQAGPGGDVIAGPFDPAALRGVQSGADTLFQFHYDPANPGAWVTLLVLRNIQASSLTADNTGAVLDLAITGTTAADTLPGGQGSDTLIGLAGADSLAADGGNDSLDGGDGADTLSGGADDDVLNGGSGNDSLDGGDGEDTLAGGAGADTLSGGAGDDLLSDTQGANLLDGGAGDDSFTDVGAGDSGSTLTGGAGQDSYSFGAIDLAAARPDTITDFATGPGGDTLDIAALLTLPLTAGLSATQNPFAAGYLRFAQSGGDTLLQVDRDGPGGSAGWTTVLTLSNTSAASLAAANLAQGWNPAGATGIARSGDDGNNSLPGSPDNDTLAGLGGNDTLIAGTGNDSLDGGDGNDRLIAGDGQDTVLGGAGADSIDAGAGDDSVDGGTGNDTIQGGAGNDSITAGDGTDSITDTSGANYIDAGAGDDTIQGIDGGDASSTITGGAGQDTYILSETPGYSPSGFHLDTITDFTPGAGGDQLNAIALLNWSQNYGSWNNTTNPFAAGYVRLAQSGADTLFQLDRDGPGGGGWTTVLLLQNTTAADFTADNFTPLTDFHGNPYLWTPTGTVNLTLTGTQGDDSLTGTIGDETLQGLAGNDTLTGGGGNDLLQGGDGNDYLYDQQGANTIQGGAGNDTIDYVDYGDTGSVLSGGAGQDRFVLTNAPGFDPTGFHADAVTDFTPGAGGDVIDIGLLLLWSQLYGGLDAATNPFPGQYLRLLQSGPDTLLQLDRDGPTGAGGFVTVLTLRNTSAAAFVAENFSPAWSLDSNPTVDNGTPGNDTLSGVITNGTLDGGAGNDSITAGPGDATVQGGSGDDTIAGLDGNALLSGGDGNDSITAGTGNDSLTGDAGNDTLADGPGAPTLAGGTGDDLYLVTNLATTIVEAPGEGQDTIRTTVSFALPANVETLIGIGTTALTLTAQANAASTLIANDAGDTLLGGAGADSLTGGAGDDSLSAAEGADTLLGGNGSDHLSGGSGNDLLDGGRGNDTLDGGDDNDILHDLLGTNLLQGGAGNDILTGTGTLDGGTGNDSLTGSNSADTIIGGAGDDTIAATPGNDCIDGGTGADTLVYAGPLSRYTITRDGAGGYLVADTISGSTDHILNVETLEFADQVFLPSSANTGGEIDGTATNDSLAGTTGLDLLRGFGGNDTITGLGGADTLDGGPGNDSLLGGAGDDTYFVDQPGDTVVELPGEGTDTVYAALAAYTLPAQVENLVAAVSDFTGTGNTLDNSITGSAGADTLDGGAGNDTLTGAGGADRLLGGEGDDRLIVSDLAFQQVSGGAGTDTLVLAGAGLALDAATLARIQGIEAIDLTGTGDNVLALNAASVLALSDTATLRIDGNAGDRLSFTDTIWTSGGTSAGYTTYSNGAATVQVAQAVTVGTTLLVTALSATRNEGDTGSTPFTFAVTRSGYVGGASTVRWSLAGTAPSFPNAADFLSGSTIGGILTFAAGETSKLITLNIAGDTVVEPDESFRVVLGAPTGAVIGVGSAIGTIINDDTGYTIAPLAAAVAEGNAGATPFTFTITRTGRIDAAGSVAWSANGILPNPAVSADFYAGTTSGVVSFAAGQSSAVLTIDIAGDTLPEPDESFSVTLATAGNPSATGTIVNDDTGFSITADTPSLREGNAGITGFRFTVTRIGPATGQDSVAWSIAGISPSFPNAADFAGGVIPGGTLTFAAGETSKTITVGIQGDRIAEPDERFSVILSQPSPGATIVTAAATATIVNDDTNFSIQAVTGSHTEGNSGTTPFVFTVTRSGDISGSNSVQWMTIGALPNSVGGPDFAGGIAPGGFLTFAAGEVTQNITVNVAGDTVLEPDEWFMVALRQPTGGATLATSTALSKIVNDDTAFAITATDAVKQEGNSGATPFTFTVTRSGNIAGTHTVSWQVSGKLPNTAGGPDFVGGVGPSGTLTFQPGEASKLITVEVQGDTTVEPDENFTVMLRNSSGGAAILVNTAGGQILNDDGVSPPPPGDVGTALTQVAAADFTGDGTPDLLRQSATGELYLLNGATAALSTLSASAAGMQFLAAADFNADGRADLLLRDGAGHLRAWLMQGATVQQNDLIATLPPTATVALVRDVTGDGRADILLHDTAAAHPYELLTMNGGSIAATATFDSLPPGW